MSGWGKWASFYQKYSRTPVIYVLSVIITIICGTIFHCKTKSGRLFLLYPSFDPPIYILDDYINNFTTISHKEKNLFISTTNSIISFIEIYVYAAYFKKLIPGKRKVNGFLFSFKNLFYTEVSTVLLYIPLAVNYIFLSKAFLCKKLLTV